MKKNILRSVIGFVFAGLIGPAVCSAVTVNLDCSAVPDLEQWAKDSKQMIEEWYPRVNNMMLTEGFTAPDKIDLVFVDDNHGIAETMGTRIRVHCDWVRKHPDDMGLVFHEMVHVLQQYGRTRYSWLMEGMTDYYRWGIYEAKPLSWFPVVPKADGYASGYQITGGLLLWLESGKAPGIVQKLNHAFHRREMKDLSIFETEAGAPIEKLWEEYMQVRKEMREGK